MLQQYVNYELPDVQADFRKGRGTKDQIANICWIMEKAREYTTLEPQLENTHETPQSSRDEGLLLLYGLESNPESSLQTPQEA